MVRMTAVPPKPQEDQQRELPPDRDAPPIPAKTPTYRGRELAGFGRRAGAELVDVLLLFVLALALGVLFGFPFERWVTESRSLLVPTREDIAFSGLFVLAAAVYYPLVMAPTNGLTLGLYLAGLRVIRENLAPMTYPIASLRGAVLKAIPLMFIGPLYLLSVLWPLWDRERRALHDMAVRTRVIRERREPGDRRGR